MVYGSENIYYEPMSQIEQFAQKLILHSVDGIVFGCLIGVLFSSNQTKKEENRKKKISRNLEISAFVAIYEKI